MLPTRLRHRRDPPRSEHGDFSEQLSARSLGSAEWQHGRRGYVRVNATSYAQPRRVRWSKEVVGQHMDDNGDQVVGCVAYPHYYMSSVAKVRQVPHRPIMVAISGRYFTKCMCEPNRQKEPMCARKMRKM